MKQQVQDWAFEQLKKYCLETKKFPGGWSRLELWYDLDYDAQNAQDTRRICYVDQDLLRIFCSRAYLVLPVTSRVGILLHEIGHLAGAFFGETDAEVRTSEVNVDLWVLREFPETDYGYLPEVRFERPIYSGARENVARNLQAVTRAFTGMLRDSYYGPYFGPPTLYTRKTIP